MAAHQKSHKKKASRRARKEARATGVPIEPAAPTGGSGRVRARVSEPAPITETVKTPDLPTAPKAATTVTFSHGKTRTDAGIDERMATVELPAIRKDLHKLALTLAVFGVIFTGLAIVGTQTEMVQNLGESLFSLWQ